MLIPEKLREARNAKGLSQRELGAIVGVSGTIIGLYEKGARSPRPRTLEKLVKALDINVDQLWTEDDADSGEDGIRLKGIMKLLEFLENPQNERKILSCWSELYLALTELQYITNNTDDNLPEEQDLRRIKIFAKIVSDCFTDLQAIAPENYAHIKACFGAWQQEKQKFDALLTEYLKLNPTGRKIISSAAIALAASNMTAKPNHPKTTAK